MKPMFFPDQKDFRKWLSENYNKENELLVGFYKVASGKPSITWSESVDQALCFGWIDGIRKSIDSESYSIRFTPRRPKSIWSNVNIKKVAELTAQGLMQEAGIKAFEKKDDSRSQIYAYENSIMVLDKKLEDEFQKNEKAWDFFQKQAPSYKKRMINWIMVSKQEATKLKRFNSLVSKSEQGLRI